MRFKKPFFLTIALIALAQGCADNELTSVETLFVNGAIYTANQQQQLVSSLGLNKDKLTYLGDAEGARNIIDEHTEIIDLEGKMISRIFSTVKNMLRSAIVSEHLDLKVVVNPSMQTDERSLPG